MVEGFIDISASLAQGIYILELRGEIVYIGTAKQMLELICGHRRLARRPVQPWVPILGITFDRAYVKPCHPDRISAELAALIETHRPRHNQPAKVLPLAKTKRRI